MYAGGDRAGKNRFVGIKVCTRDLEKVHVVETHDCWLIPTTINTSLTEGPGPATFQEPSPGKTP